MKRILWGLGSLLLFSLAFSEEPFYYFVPPKTWDVVDPSKLTPMFKIAFVEHSTKAFKPSLNLGIQKVNVSLSQYIEAAKKQHLTNRNKKWSELGMVKTRAGDAHISQIDEKAQFGEIRSMQCILLQSGYVYVITAVALREDFLTYHNEFLQAFESFSIYPSTRFSFTSEELKNRYESKVQELKHQWALFLANNYTSKEPKKAFEDKRFQRGPWKDFEKFLSKNFKNQGLFWQVMASKEVRNSLLESQPSINEMVADRRP